MKYGFTMAGAGQGALLFGWSAKGHAFTMAEILLSLTIIGVVAAITLPSLTGNINERTWNTQRKALYARMSQAISLMPALSGYGIGTDDNETISKAAETFVTSGLAKVLKINNVCDYSHLGDCGIPDKITPLGNASVLNLFTTSYNQIGKFNLMMVGSYEHTYSIIYGDPQLNTYAAAFETANGESIVVYYNPNCKPDMGETEQHYTQPKMCANFVYDLNGSKGPNTVGKDIGFITAMYSSDPVVVTAIPLVTNAGSFKHKPDDSSKSASQACKEQNSDSRLPNRDELAAMFYNRTLLGLTGGRFWSSSVVTSNKDKAWFHDFNTGYRFPYQRSLDNIVRCVYH